MIYKSWMVLNILDKFYYHASKQHSYYCYESVSYTHLTLPTILRV